MNDNTLEMVYRTVYQEEFKDEYKGKIPDYTTWLQRKLHEARPKSQKSAIPIVSEWVAVEDALPICYMTGGWDGKMSDLLLVQDEKGRYHLANCYEYHDGQVEWYDQDDYGLRHEIMKWKAVE